MTWVLGHTRVTICGGCAEPAAPSLHDQTLSCRKLGLAFQSLGRCSQGKAGAGGNRTDPTLVPWARLSGDRTLQVFACEYQFVQYQSWAVADKWMFH